MILSLIVGFLIGLFYGYSFVLQQRSIFFLQSTSYTSSKIIVILLFLSRVCLIGLCSLFILRSSIINSILVILTFVTAFWLIILKKKAIFHEES